MAAKISDGKTNVLLVGSGGIGTMVAYALEAGGRAEVTAVLRSNFKAVQENGFSIDAMDHDKNISGWKPTTIRSNVPQVSKENLKPYDFIVVTTKNLPDVSPTVLDIITPAITEGVTSIVLMQNGLNIEKPIIKAFPNNVVLSGVQLMGAAEVSLGHIRQDDHDISKVGPFTNPQIPAQKSRAAAQRWVDIYNACGTVRCTLDDDVTFTRWRKLVYNASFNSVATILRTDVIRMRIYEHVIDSLVKPIMLEIVAIARAAGANLPDEIVMTMLLCDPPETWFLPSMGQDIRKGNYIEFENIVGEPLREAQKLGVPCPVLKTSYDILKGIQALTKEAKGSLKPEFGPDSKYAG